MHRFAVKGRKREARSSSWVLSRLVHCLCIDMVSYPLFSNRLLLLGFGLTRTLKIDSQLRSIQNVALILSDN